MPGGSAPGPRLDWRERNRETADANGHAEIGRQGSGAGAGHLAHGRAQAGAGGGGGGRQAGPRSRHPARRHGRDVRRRRCRGDARRGAGRPARRRFPGEQGLSAQRLAQRRRCRLREEPEAAEDRQARPLPPALARLASPGGDGGGLRDPEEGRQDPPMGGEQPRCPRHGGAGGRQERRQLRVGPGALPPRLARRGMAAARPLPQGQDHGDGLLAAGPGPAAVQARPRQGRRQAPRRARGRGARLGAAPARRDRDHALARRRPGRISASASFSPGRQRDSPACPNRSPRAART